MPELELADQLVAYVDATTTEVPPPHHGHQDPVGRQPWRRVAAAAGIAAALVGVVVWLGTLDDDSPTITDTPTTLAPTPTTTDPEPATDPEPTTPSEPSPDDPGAALDGPRLAIADLPLSDASSLLLNVPLAQQPGVWIDGALHVLAQDDVVVRSADGTEWEVAAELDRLAPADWSGVAMAGSSDGLVAVATADLSEDFVSLSGVGDAFPRFMACVNFGDLLAVATSPDGRSWESGQVAAPVIDRVLDLDGCVSGTSGVRSAVGNGRVVVWTSLRVSFDDATYAAHRLAELRPDLDYQSLEVRDPDPDDGRVTVVLDRTVGKGGPLDDGQEIEIPIDLSDFEAAQQRFEQSLADDVGPSGELGVAWESTDGATWSVVEMPRLTTFTDGGSTPSLVGSPEGFYALTDDRVVQFSADLTTWEEVATDSPVVSIQRWGEGAITSEHTALLENPQLLEGPPIPDTAAGLDQVFLLGDGTVFGIAHTQPIELHWSDGDSAARWTPEEIDNGTSPVFARILGVGDDFVVIWASGQLYVATVP